MRPATADRYELGDVQLAICIDLLSLTFQLLKVASSNRMQIAARTLSYYATATW